MTATDLQADLALARDAAVEVGAIAMRFFRADPLVRMKGAEQPVTEADLEIDAELNRLLLAPRPGYGWLSEETTDTPARLGRDRVWIVDPIDGTNSFIEGRPEFVVSIGLAVGGRAVLGVLHNPASGETYTAIHGGGARLGGRPIRVAQPPATGAERVLVGSRSELDRGELEQYRDRWRILPMGSTAYRMAKVAEGAGHLYVSRGRKAEWDVCAAVVIVEEAGGSVHQHTGDLLRFNQPVPFFDGIVASCGVAPEV